MSFPFLKLTHHNYIFAGPTPQFLAVFLVEYGGFLSGYPMPRPVQGIVVDDLRHRAVAQRQLLSVHGVDAADLLRQARTGEVEFVQQLLLRWGKQKRKSNENLAKKITGVDSLRKKHIMLYRKRKGI